MERDKLLDQFTREELLEEAEWVEDCGEWRHMSLMGYMPEELREYVDEYMPETEQQYETK